MSYDYTENILVQESAGKLLHDELGWEVVFAYNQEKLGENGTLVVNRDGWEVIPENVSGNKRMEAVELHKPYGGGGLELHVKNHLECIKARTPEKCHASIQIGAHIAKFAHLGNIAYRTGKKLTWDGTSFHDREADKYLCKEYHNKWKFPKV